MEYSQNKQIGNGHSELQKLQLTTQNVRNSSQLETKKNFFKPSINENQSREFDKSLLSTKLNARNTPLLESDRTSETLQAFIKNKNIKTIQEANQLQSEEEKPQEGNFTRNIGNSFTNQNIYKENPLQNIQKQRNVSASLRFYKQNPAVIVQSSSGEQTHLPIQNYLNQSYSQNSNIFNINFQQNDLQLKTQADHKMVQIDKDS